MATGVGFIALAGVSAEFGVIMLLYLKNAWPNVKTSVTAPSGGWSPRFAKVQCYAFAPQGHDRGGDHRRFVADPLGQWHW
ncbi:hypothetical protein EY04_24065 [Pseudomonas chlororaphis]|nr:hypothetical protein EY04_24065 [Pseudomonas chlororaphis]